MIFDGTVSKVVKNGCFPLTERLIHTHTGNSNTVQMGDNRWSCAKRTPLLNQPQQQCIGALLFLRLH